MVYNDKLPAFQNPKQLKMLDLFISLSKRFKFIFIFYGWDVAFWWIT